MSSAGHYAAFGMPPIRPDYQYPKEIKVEDIIKAIGLSEVIREKGGPRDRVNPRTLLEVSMEYTRAIQLHGHFHSLHDGYGVMAEEFDEFWDEIKARHPDRAKLKEEAIQLAAMCLKFVDDFCTDEQIANETGHAAPKRDD